ncbi:phenylacetate-CoA ligase [Anoxybacillus vitaminiphilus]|uniref:Phenylacetate-CoA ligase n=1 Tax=Paranoxybacillus vitaminiphilus TaxID=581036 RepID=A0A327YPB5_9BACL|nr:AMP-binding protein [Anoxybacillus vitaminiphilus]RAK22107.1 phenylacetate-CoA ligase [Anoxybacillus vitaminiphilus]
MEKQLQRLVEYAYKHSAPFRERLNEVNLLPADICTMKDLEKIPVLKKEDLPGLQKLSYPFGGLATRSAAEMARIFMSPGPIYDPQTYEGDYWRFAEALRAAGFTEQDIVQNTFSYHLSPAGFMFDSALRHIGATVIPAGPGNRELQIQIMCDIQVTGYVGTPSFLSLLIDAVEEKGWTVGKELRLRKAFFTAEMLTNEMRESFESKGMEVYEGYGTADCGCLAFEDKKGPGLKVASGVIMQICDPVTGTEVFDSEGEIVVTLFDQSYPLIRFGTGDLSRWIKGYEGKRIAGVLGRVGTSVKVKGMFVHERQLANLLSNHGYERFQAIVTRKDEQDILEIFVESDEPLDEQLVAKVKEVIRVTPIITRVAHGTLPKDIKKILIDKREWNKSTTQ